MSERDSTPSVSFGHREVTPTQKTQLVGDVFRSVAGRYDLMNDLMSLGSHRLFKRMTVELSGIRKHHDVLDLAGGTGDLSALYASKARSVTLADLTADMMQVARDRLLDAGHTNVRFCQLRAEALPFADARFDCVSIGFGLRNFTSKDTALREVLRVLKPGGVLIVLEFSKPRSPMLGLAYSGFQTLWPAMGQAVAGDAGSYRYLVESIERHPDQKVLKLMMEDAGFNEVEYHDLLGGIAAIHRGVRPRA